MVGVPRRAIWGVSHIHENRGQNNAIPMEKAYFTCRLRLPEKEFGEPCPDSWRVEWEDPRPGCLPILGRNDLKSIKKQWVSRALVTMMLVAIAAMAQAGVTQANAPSAAAVKVVVDIGPEAGLLPSFNNTWAAQPVDYNNDGDQDVWIGYHQAGVVKGTQGGGRLWRNNGDGTYTWVARNAWPRIKPNGKQPDRHDCTFADFDHNGLVDSYCSAGRNESNLVKFGMENELWLQDSVGTFTEHGVAWGVGDVCGRGRFVTTLDANGDGWADIFLGNETGRNVTDACDNPNNGYPNEEAKLFLNNANGTGFTYAPQFIRFGAGPGQRCAEAFDYDGDGWDDLIACRLKGQAPLLYHNNQGTGFTLLSGTASGLTTAVADAVVADMNRDGRPDLVFAAKAVFSYQLNTGGGARWFAAPVTIRSFSLGEGRSVAVGDADGDGDLDVYGMVGNGSSAGNPNDFLLLNNGLLGFTSLVPPAATGEADEVISLTPAAGSRARFLSLNGGGKTGGPIQLMVAQ